MYEIYCDGATSNNGYANARGGWGYVILKNGEIIHKDSGNEKTPSLATNQRMELTACLQACDWLMENEPFVDVVTVYSDSAYLINCYRENWWESWEKNGWKNAKKQPVANADLWKRTIFYFSLHNYDFVKVKGHAGNEWNELVDKMAVEAKNR